MTQDQSEATLKKAIDARRLQAFAQLTDEDAEILFACHRRWPGQHGARVVALDLIREERKEENVALFGMEARQKFGGSIVEVVTVNTLLDQLDDGREAIRAAK